MLELTALPARQGDALWIRWGDPSAPHQMLIDMGTGEIGKSIRSRLEQLPVEQRSFELLVVTHVDSDHIGGVITGLVEAEALDGFKFDDVWFNGFVHLSGGTAPRLVTTEAMGPADGERLANWLRQQPWNEAFNRGPVWRQVDAPLQQKTLRDGLKLTVLGPTPDRLSGFVHTWAEAVREALEKSRLDPDEVDPVLLNPGIESLGRPVRPTLDSEAALLRLAEKSRDRDDKHANGSSIVLLLEYRGRKILLAGDAFSSDMVEAIAAASPDSRLHVDVFKLPHHGSRGNVHRDLVEALDCDYWLISTDGTTHFHPNADAVARVVCFASPGEPRLGFNVPSTFNGWWDNDDWRQMHGYSVEYGTAEDGLTLTFEVEE